MQLTYNKILYEYDLPHRAIAVYMYLRDRYNTKTGLCFPSVSTISREMNLSKRTVYRALIDLEKARFIERIHRSRNNGARSSNQYQLLK